MLNVEVFRPGRLNELWRVLRSVGRPRRYLGGGTDLVVLAKRDMGTPCRWVDLTALKEIKIIRKERGGLFIGAGVTYAELERSREVEEMAPTLHAVCPEFASPPVRSLATLGGNCANASPAADGIPALYVEGARVRLGHFGKRREIPVEKLFVGPGKTILKPDELILGFFIPRWESHKGIFLKLGHRRLLSIAKLSVAVALEFEGRNVKKIRVALGAVAPTVIRAFKTEDFVTGRLLDEETIGKAKEIAMGECRPITDHRSTAEYRRAVVGVLVGRALARLIPC